MLKTYREEITIRTTQADHLSSWRPSAILESMQEIAGTHAELIGVGRNALIQKNLAWVYTRLEVEMDRYPKIGETVSIETWPMPVRRWFFPRYFIVRDAREQEIGRAGSLWVLLDLTSRRMSSPDSVSSLMPDNSDLVAPLGLPAPVTEVSGTLESSVHEVVYTDLDVNRHVNNVRYIDWCCNALGIDTMSTSELAHFIMNFDMEIRPGEQIRTDLRRLDNAFSFAGFCGQERRFDIGGLLRPRR